MPKNLFKAADTQPLGRQTIYKQWDLHLLEDGSLQLVETSELARTREELIWSGTVKQLQDSCLLCSHRELDMVHINLDDCRLKVDCETEHPHTLHPRPMTFAFPADKWHEFRRAIPV